MWILDILKKIKDKYYDIIDDIMEFLDDNNIIRRKQFVLKKNNP